MASDGWDDLLFLLTICEGAVCLLCTYGCILLAMYRTPQERWLPVLAVFGVSAVAMALTAAISDLRAQHRARHHLR